MSRYQLVKAVTVPGVNGTHVRVRAGGFLADSGAQQGDVSVTTNLANSFVTSGAAVLVGNVGSHPTGADSVDA